MLGRLFDRPVEQRASSFWQPWGDGVSTTSGVAVSVETATQLLAVYGSVHLIADQVSTLPVDVYRERNDGAKVEVSKPDWLTQPTVDLGWVDWCGQVLWSLLLHGNAYIVVNRNERAGIVELPVVDPTQVEVMRAGSTLRYFVAGRQYTGELMHIKGLMRPGDVVGLSPIAAARQSIGLGLAAQQHGAAFFDGEGNMPGVIESPGRMQPGQMAELAELWRRRRRSGGKGLPGVLDGGATWKPTGLPLKDMQFLESRQWTAAEVAGQVFLLDPSDLGIPVAGTSLTYANLADRNARRVQVALLPWIIRIEKAVSALLAAPRYVKLNVDGLLRGNAADRFAMYEAASRINAAAATLGQGPVLTTDEMRELEDLPPLDAVPAVLAADAAA